MKIKHTNGKVTFALRVGKNTFVKSETNLAYAQSILNRGKEKELTDSRGYGMEIAVDDTYFFPADTSTKRSKKDDSEVE